MPPVLIDTNILVYIFDPHDTNRQQKSIDIVRMLEEVGSGRLCVQCLAEFFRVTTGKLHLSPEAIYQEVQHWIQSFPVINLTPQIVLEAARGVRDHQMAYYDTQIWAAARLNQIPVVFSEDFQDGQILEGVRFVNPYSESFVLKEWV
jgi:predicted nucleic acid-binding protein